MLFIEYPKCTTCQKAKKWLDGMLVKRPLLIGENFVVTGFKEQEWENVTKNTGNV